MNLLFSFKELYESNKIAFIAIAAAGAVLLLALILLIIHAIAKRQIKASNPEESLISETLKEDAKLEQQKQQEAKAEPVVEEEPLEEKEEVKPAPVKKAPAKKAPAKKAEPKKEVIQEEKVEEAPVVEEKAEEPVSEPVVEDAPVVEEAKVEEVSVAEEEVKEEAPKKAPAKKAPAKKAPTKKAEPKEEVKEDAKEEAAPKKAPAKKAPAKKEEAKKRTVTGKYEVYFDGEKYFYILKASNGEQLIQSELYASKTSVLNAIEAVKKNAVEGTVHVAADKRGMYQFTLTATNHRKLVMSANYPTKSGAESASESFKRFAPISPVVEIQEQVESLKEEIKPSYEDKNGGKIGVIKEGDKFHYILKASNGEVLINGENFATPEKAQSGLETFKAAINEGKFFVEKDKRGMYQFKLYSKTGRLIVAGESYPSKNNAISACNSLCSYVKLATPIE